MLNQFSCFPYDTCICDCWIWIVIFWETEFYFLKFVIILKCVKNCEFYIFLKRMKVWKSEWMAATYIDVVDDDVIQRRRRQRSLPSSRMAATLEWRSFCRQWCLPSSCSWRQESSHSSFVSFVDANKASSSDEPSTSARCRQPVSKLSAPGAPSASIPRPTAPHNPPSNTDASYTEVY